MNQKEVQLYLFEDDMIVCRMNQNYPKAIPELINMGWKVVGYTTNKKQKQNIMAKVLSTVLGPG